MSAIKMWMLEPRADTDRLLAMEPQLSYDRNVISVGAPLPGIAAAYAGADRFAHVVLRYPGRVVELIVDLAPVLKARYAYAPLIKDDALFATLRVNQDGTALEFNGGLEISALWIERLPDSTTRMLQSNHETL